MKRILAMLSLCLMMFLPYGCEEANAKGVVEVVSAEEMKSITMMDEIQLIDVRTEEEYESGHIEGAENLVLDDNFREKIQELDKSKPVAVYCLKGGRSARCTEIMKAEGFTKIYDLEGGLTTWKKADLPIVNE
ncbi:rhodanese-like domain-containing protein [Croceiramulus getboli]|nr:rhodanese-like domain-containing protein [Flavobacteriaceae bacterium YJPT1-3]